MQYCTLIHTTILQAETSYVLFFYNCNGQKWHIHGVTKHEEPLVKLLTNFLSAYKLNYKLVVAKTTQSSYLRHPALSHMMILAMCL